MSVLDFERLLDWEEARHGDQKECWLCGDKLRRIATVWRGYVGDIVLHPGCAMDLAHHLIFDAMNAETIERHLLDGNYDLLGGVPDHLRGDPTTGGSR